MFASPRSELLALLAAIKAEPEEDTPKFALADWLQEQPGEADRGRGEFLNRLVGSDPTQPFPPRLQELWTRYETEWAGALQGAGFQVGAAHDLFRWGLLFPTLTSTAAPATGDPVVRTEEFAWVAGATVRAVDAASGSLLAAAPVLAPLVGLRAAPAEGRRAFLVRFAEAPHAAGLLELDISGAGRARNPYPLGALARSPHLTQLCRLVVRNGNLDADNEQFRQLWGSSGLPALRSLDLSGCDLDSHTGRVLAAATGLPALTELVLTRNRIYDTGVTALVEGPHLGRLRKLALASNGIGEAGAAVLSQARHLCNLTHLDLSGNHIPSRAAVELVTADHLRTIEELNLSANDIGDAAAQALAQCPGLPNLRRLDLTGNRISSRTAKALRNRFGAAVLLN